MDQSSSRAAAQILFPLMLASFIWIITLIWRSGFIEERLESKSSSESEANVRLQILVFSASFVVGVFLASLIYLSLLGFMHPNTLPSFEVILFSFFACSLLSFRIVHLGTGSDLLDCFISGAGETFVGLSSGWGLHYLTVNHISIEGTFFQLLLFGSLAGLVIRASIYLERGI